jgi:hypothetical protein
MKVCELLAALPQVGNVKAQKIIVELEIAPSRRRAGGVIVSVRRSWRRSTRRDSPAPTAYIGGPSAEMMFDEEPRPSEAPRRCHRRPYCVGTLAAVWLAMLTAESAGLALHVLTSITTLFLAASARPHPQPGALAFC